jgi:hypothetical protein
MLVMAGAGHNSRPVLPEAAEYVTDVNTGDVGVTNFIS